jgi:hypothetical protein
LEQPLIKKEGTPSEPIPMNALRSLISALTSSAKVVDMDKKLEFTKRGKIIEEEYDCKWTQSDGRKYSL